MKAIITPNLPQHSVRVAVVAESAPEVLASLAQEGIEVVTVRAINHLPEPVSAHSDLQLLHLGGNQILLAHEAFYLSTELTKFGFAIEYLCRLLGNRYPNDVSLNFLLLNNCYYGLSSESALQVKNRCNHAGLQEIATKQGYARCSVAIVAQYAAITADDGLYRLLVAAGVDVLHITPGNILLPGYDTGFIGGCCGLIAPQRMAFTGSLNCYSQGAAVQAFLKKHGVEPVYLTDGMLLDIGGILPLVEEEE